MRTRPLDSPSCQPIGRRIVLECVARARIAIILALTEQGVLLQVEAVIALDVARRPDGLGQDVEAWATCPATENGFIRIASHPNYPNRPGGVTAVFAILRQLCEAPGHHFWTEDISILQIFESDAIITHAQNTDVYLLGLAVHKGGKLATLDQRIPVAAVRGGREALELIMP